MVLKNRNIYGLMKLCICVFILIEFFDLVIFNDVEGLNIYRIWNNFVCFFKCYCMIN